MYHGLDPASGLIGRLYVNSGRGIQFVLIYYTYILILMPRNALPDANGTTMIGRNSVSISPNSARVSNLFLFNLDL